MTDQDVTDAPQTENPFWDYSVALYRREGVKDACLALQDEAGADINLLLFLCWIAQSGRGRLTRAEIQSGMAAVAVWRVQVLLPLRRVRRRLSKDPDSDEAGLRQNLLKLELDAERIEQDRLLAAVKRDPVPLQTTAEIRRSDAEYNCGIYLDEFKIRLEGDLEAAFERLMDAATRD